MAHVERCVHTARRKVVFTAICALIGIFLCVLATRMEVHVDEATGQKAPVRSRKRRRKAEGGEDVSQAQSEETETPAIIAKKV